MPNIVIPGREFEDVDLMIFDKDGTLTDVHQYWHAMIEMRAALICERLGLPQREQRLLMEIMGVDCANHRVKPQGPVGIKKREIVMRAAVDYLILIGQPDRTLLCEEVFRDVDALSVERLDRIVVPIEGFDRLFADLRRAGCGIAVATTDRTDRGVLAMKHLGVLEAIGMVAGADLVERGKPDPEMANLILRTLNVPARKAVMVGDALTDVRMGIAAGLRAAIGVTSGLTDRRDLLAVTPHVVSGISEIRIF